MTTQTGVASIGRRGNFHFDTDYAFDAGTGLSEEVVRYISEVKEEDPWMLDFRMKGLSTFEKKPLPTHWATKDLENIDFGHHPLLLVQRAKTEQNLGRSSGQREEYLRKIGYPRAGEKIPGRRGSPV